MVNGRETRVRTQGKWAKVMGEGRTDWETRQA